MTRSRYLSAAQAWDAAGRPRGMLMNNEYGLLAMRCWFHSEGAEAEGLDPIVAQFGDASEAAYEEGDPDWYDRFLSHREHCDRCGARYMLENLSICTGCLGVYCFDCVDDNRAPNGNRAHGCGGEIVG